MTATQSASVPTGSPHPSSRLHPRRNLRGGQLHRRHHAHTRPGTRSQPDALSPNNRHPLPIRYNLPRGCAARQIPREKY
ncbi:hypothetical protein BDW62DRAFT_175346 [Aspergillus aurantiobrunneus]